MARIDRSERKLRKAIIRLAKARPSLRADLIPLLKRGSAMWPPRKRDLDWTPAFWKFMKELREDLIDWGVRRLETMSFVNFISLLPMPLMTCKTKEA